MYYCYIFCVNKHYMNDTDINDIRSIKDFKGISFSNYKKSEVNKELIKCLNQNKIESACNWTAELICAGHYIDLWETILLYSSKYIHLGNPKLPIYLNMRFDNFKEIVKNGYIDNELAMRNNSKIRVLFSEIITVICTSQKKPSFESIKINKVDEFNLQHISSKFKAPNIEFIKSYFKQKDPKELFIPLNEYAYNVKNNNIFLACYWAQWIIDFELLCRKKKDIITCERRAFVPVNDKFQFDPIWIIWEILLDYSNKDKLKNKIIISLLELFCIRYSFSFKKKRRYILYFAHQIVMEKYAIRPIIENNSIVDTINKKINTIYKQVKKNEKAPETDYLFDSLSKEKSNLEKTIEKLDKLESINTIVPRS